MYSPSHSHSSCQRDTDGREGTGKVGMGGEVFPSSRPMTSAFQLVCVRKGGSGRGRRGRTEGSVCGGGEGWRGAAEGGGRMLELEE